MSRVGSGQGRVISRRSVLASRGPSVDFLKVARTRVPVVFAYSGDPVVAGFADNLAPC